MQCSLVFTIHVLKYRQLSISQAAINTRGILRAYPVGASSDRGSDRLMEEAGEKSHQVKGKEAPSTPSSYSHPKETTMAISTSPGPNPSSRGQALPATARARYRIQGDYVEFSTMNKEKLSYSQAEPGQASCSALA